MWGGPQGRCDLSHWRPPVSQPRTLPPAYLHLPTRGLCEVDRLGTVERYFVEVKNIPRLAERIRCFIFTRTYAATRARVRGWAGDESRGRLKGAGWLAGDWSRAWAGVHAACGTCSPPSRTPLPAKLPALFTAAPPAPPLPVPPHPVQCVTQLDLVRTACSELQGCAAFSKLLQAVLELGNHLNQVGGWVCPWPGSC